MGISKRGRVTRLYALSRVNNKITTGDNEHAARVIALECRIPNLDEDFNNEAVIEQGIFKKYSLEERTSSMNHVFILREENYWAFHANPRH